jgi:hypothetical protein
LSKKGQLIKLKSILLSIALGVTIFSQTTTIQARNIQTLVVAGGVFGVLRLILKVSVG